MISVSKNNICQRRYSYDSFSNRSELIDLEERKKITYSYNELNQLTNKTTEFLGDGFINASETFSYDRRGNLVSIVNNGQIINQYSYGTSNRLEESKNQAGEMSQYYYNGLGFRVGKQEFVSYNDNKLLSGSDIFNEKNHMVSLKKVDYLIDMTKQYFNLLEKEDAYNCEEINKIDKIYQETYPTEGKSVQSYLWDGKIVGMIEDNKCYSILKDELGSPIRIMDEESEIADSYGYNEFGEDKYNNQGRLQPFGYTGYQYDDISKTYFAQAREYKPEDGRFLGCDWNKGNLTDPITKNSYIYCYNEPLIRCDFDGEESIVVSGGSNDSFKYQFIETGLHDINDQIANGTPPEEITWMVIDAGYSSTDIAHFQSTANSLGINIVIVENKTDFINYINDKNGVDSRADDQITDMSFYCHGQCPTYSGSAENQLSFSYNCNVGPNRTNADIDFTQSDIASLDPNAFDQTRTVFYSCNSGTDDANGNSFAQTWSNTTGGPSLGIRNGRSFYGAINSVGDWGFYTGIFGHKCVIPADYLYGLLDIFGISIEEWEEKQRRSRERETNGLGYSESGSLNYPWLVSLAGDLDTLKDLGILERGFTWFYPETCE